MAHPHLRMLLGGPYALYHLMYSRPRIVLCFHWVQSTAPFPYMVMNLLLFGLLFVSPTICAALDNLDNKCELITIPLCKDSLYNETRFPNLLGHQSQNEALASIQHFRPLVHAKCSKHLKFFLCSIFTPMCSHRVDEPITSCKSVCEEVKRSCQDLLREYDIEWPEMLNCSKFPTEGLCMQPFENSNPKQPVLPHSQRDSKDSSDTMGISDTVSHCAVDFVQIEPGHSGSSCTALCGRQILFIQEHKDFAELWMAVWASLCLIVTAFTVITCWLDGQRFNYPERSIIHLAACYHIYSWAFIARLIMSSGEVACQPLKDGRRHLIAGGLDNPKCVIIFIILYYFSIASSIWFCVLTFTWFLSASKKWSHEAIDACSSYFHLAAWGSPALLSIAVLISHKVDSSELTGLCFVGNSDPLALGAFVIGPLCLFLLLGLLFDLLAFSGGCQVRAQLRNRGDCRDIGKLDKLMVKIGIFSFLYVIPALCVIGGYIYHLSVLLEWSPILSGCKKTRVDGKIDPSCVRPETRPRVEVYMLSVFMQLMVGVTSGMWVGSRKTCHTWMRFLCCGLLSSPGVKSKLVAGGSVSTPLVTNYPTNVFAMTNRSEVHRTQSHRTDSSRTKHTTNLYAPVGSSEHASKV